MSLRVDIQKRITELIQSGTFKEVTYDSQHHPVEEVYTLSPTSIVVQETGGGLTDSVKTGATSSGMVLTNWRFEAVAEFTSEVDVSQFMLAELRRITFNVDNLVVSIVPSGDFQVTHPPRNAAHNGTKLTLGLTVNTRR